MEILSSILVRNVQRIVPEWEEVITDNEWTQRAPSYSSSDELVSLLVFNGELYASPSGWSDGVAGTLIKWNGLSGWEVVCPRYMTYGWDLKLFEFNGKIYGGTGGGNIGGSFRLLEWTPGTSEWVLRAGPYYGYDYGCSDLIDWAGELYGVDAWGLLKWNGTDAWELMAAHPTKGNYGFKTGIVFNGKIYCAGGDSYASLGHSQLLEWDGVDTFIDILTYDTYGMIMDLVVFNEKLYACTYTGRLLSWDGIASSWTHIGHAGIGYLWCLAVYKDNLYMASYNFGRLARLMPDDILLQVAGTYSNESTIWSMTEYQGLLFAGARASLLSWEEETIIHKNERVRSINIMTSGSGSTWAPATYCFYNGTGTICVNKNNQAMISYIDWYGNVNIAFAESIEKVLSGESTFSNDYTVTSLPSTSMSPSCSINLIDNKLYLAFAYYDPTVQNMKTALWVDESGLGYSFVYRAAIDPETTPSGMGIISNLQLSHISSIIRLSTGHLAIGIKSATWSDQWQTMDARTRLFSSNDDGITWYGSEGSGSEQYVGRDGISICEFTPGVLCILYNESDSTSDILGYTGEHIYEFYEGNWEYYGLWSIDWPGGPWNLPDYLRYSYAQFFTNESGELFTYLTQSGSFTTGIYKYVGPSLSGLATYNAADQIGIIENWKFIQSIDGIPSNAIAPFVLNLPNKTIIGTLGTVNNYGEVYVTTTSGQSIVGKKARRIARIAGTPL